MKNFGVYKTKHEMNPETVNKHKITHLTFFKVLKQCRCRVHAVDFISSKTFVIHVSTSGFLAGHFEAALLIDRAS